MGIRLEPIDEYMHELGPESNFNESMYFNVYDPKQEVGGWFRCGNRANEGHAEMTVCLYLPGGRVAFMFKRAEISNNDAFDAGGIRFDVIEPFERLDVSYSGKVVVLDDPLQMADPEEGLHREPVRRVRGADRVHRRVRRCSAASPTRPHETPGEEFAKGHYEQLIAGKGTIRVGDEEWEIDGFGLRDHSWGPRYWQAPWYYRWLTANFGDDFGFMGSRVAKRDGDGTRGGFVWEDGQLHLCNDFEIATDWVGDDTYHDVDPRHAALRRQGVEGHRQGDRPHPAAQPPARSRRQHARDPDLRGHDRVDARGRPQGLRPVGVPRPDHRRPARRPRRVAGLVGLGARPSRGSRARPTRTRPSTSSSAPPRPAAANTSARAACTAASSGAASAAISARWPARRRSPAAATSSARSARRAGSPGEGGHLGGEHRVGRRA